MYFYAVLANFFKLGHSFPLYIPPLLLPPSHHRHGHSSRLTPTSPPPQPPILRIFHLGLPLLSRKSASILSKWCFNVHEAEVHQEDWINYQIRRVLNFSLI
jgi:hypothetical protein